MNPVKASSQTAHAVVLIQFDDTIALPPLTARAGDVKSVVSLYLRRIYSHRVDLMVSLGDVNCVLADGRLAGTFTVTPFAPAAPVFGIPALGVAA